MPRLTLVLPFSLPPAEHARDLIAQLRAPALAKMLARASGGLQAAPAAFQACLPHESWLSGRTHDNSPALAHATMQALGLAACEGFWFVLQPVHLHLARDHLVLTDYRRLNLSEPEARSLFDAAAPLFAEQSQTLMYGNANLWFLRVDNWAELRTCTPDAACGHNIDIWLPSASDGSTYNLAAADNWAAGATPSANIADTTGNAITVSNVALPSITSVL